MYGVNTYIFCVYTVNFWDSYNVFLKFYFNNLLKNAKLSIKKKNQPIFFSKFWVGRKRANKHFLGLLIMTLLCGIPVFFFKYF